MLINNLYTNFYYLKSVYNCYTPLKVNDSKINNYITIIENVNICYFANAL